MTEPMIEETEEFTDELSDEALDRAEGTKSSGPPPWPHCYSRTAD
jgi:hypothetical protein